MSKSETAPPTIPPINAALSGMFDDIVNVVEMAIDSKIVTFDVIEVVVLLESLVSSDVESPDVCVLVGAKVGVSGVVGLGAHVR
jgi:hypothetical protein